SVAASADQGPLDPQAPRSSGRRPREALLLCLDSSDLRGLPNLLVQSAPAQSDPGPAANRSLRSPATHRKRRRANVASAYTLLPPPLRFHLHARNRVLRPAPCVRNAAGCAATSRKENPPDRSARKRSQRVAAPSTAADS